MEIFEMFEKMNEVMDVLKDTTDVGFMSIICMLFDTRFGKDSVARASDCLEQMKVINAEFGALEN